jgi:2-furoyl-CoA dehydrogenase large subunit
MSDMSGTTWVGRSLPRREDDRLTTGAATFVDDIKLPRMLHAAILRSPHAHARILALDAEPARRMPGVLAVLTGEDARRVSRPLPSLIPLPVSVPAYCLAVGKVRYVGEPMAMVAAVDRATAEDAVERIRVEYEPLPPVIDAVAAIESKDPLVFEELGSNVLWHDTFTYGDVDARFAAARHVLRERFAIHRYVSTPLETYGVVARWESDGVTLWCPEQRPALVIRVVATVLGLPQSRVRLIAPDIGGSFGNKRKTPYLAAVALLAQMTGRPVKYVEDRRESLMALLHAANGVMDLSLALTADGRITALDVRDVVDEGANLLYSSLHTITKLTNTHGCYGVPAVRFEGFSVVTNKCPTGPNRGVGKPFMCFALERAVDLAARTLDLDPAEIRRRNFIPATAMPYDSPIGNQHDSGDYPATLEKALAMVGYDELRARQERLRLEGRWLGIGIASSVEPNSSNEAQHTLISGKPGPSGAGEAAMVRIELDGSVRVATGNIPAGQGHRTVISQIVADELGVTPDDVNVNSWFDSALNPWLYASGAFANKFAGTDTGAIVGAARRLRFRVLEIAAALTGVTSDRLELRDRGVWEHGADVPCLSLVDVAQIAYRDLLRLPVGLEPGLEARCYFVDRHANLVGPDRRVKVQLNYSNSAHIVVVEVDVATGAVKILRYVIVHDCGRELNPMIVEGLAHGATAHGIGGALLEEFVYDDQGQLLTASFMDYPKPTALDVPEFEIAAMESPSPVTPLGAKGVGEGGSIPSPAAIANAVADALAPLGVRITSLPLTPARVWEAIQSRAGQTRGA